MEMLNYAARQQENIDLSELNTAMGELKHKNLIDAVPEAKSLDKLLFNEQTMIHHIQHSGIRCGDVETYA